MAFFSWFEFPGLVKAWLSFVSRKYLTLSRKHILLKSVVKKA